MIGTYLVALVVLRWTYFGRDVYAVGGNVNAARLSGINVAFTLVLVYAIAGLCAGIGGVIQAGRLGAASPSSARAPRSTRRPPCCWAERAFSAGSAV